MEVLKEEKETRWSTRILLILNLIIWAIILFMIILWNGVVNAAQTTTWADMTNYTFKNANNEWTSYTNGSNAPYTQAVYEIQAGFSGSTGVVNGRIEMEIRTSNMENINNLDFKIWYNGGFYNNFSLTRQFTRTQTAAVFYTWHIVYEFNMTNTNNGFITIVIKPNNPVTAIGGWTIVGGASTMSLEQATSQDISQQTIDIINSITNNIQQSISNSNSQYNILGDKMDTLNNSIFAEYTPENPDKADFDDFEDVEDELKEYTNVNLESFNVDLDTDTNNWVWTTLTNLIQANALVFGMVISILSIGLIKLIMNR